MQQSPKRRTRARRRAAEPQARPGVNLRESPLAWLAKRKDRDGRPLITDAEFAAGEKLRADFFFAAMTPQVTLNWARMQDGDSRRPGAGPAQVDLADGILAARERVRLALKAVGPDLAGILIDVCCHLKGLEIAEKAGGWPQRSGKVVLGIALRNLARHYGMLPMAPQGPMSIRHWGSADYRPRIETDAG